MGIVLVVCYLVQLAFAAYMTHRLLIKQKKGKILFVAVFYTFTVICTLARILNVIVLVDLHTNEKYKIDRDIEIKADDLELLSRITLYIIDSD